MKSQRQERILQIIAQERIETQNQLIDALRRRGMPSTQATVSRDMRELRLVKELGTDGSYRYVPPADTAVGDHTERLRTIFRESVNSYACAQNLVVVKTLPGLANAACAALDSMEINGMVGSIAGDDTIFLAMTDTPTAERFCRELHELV